MRDFRGLLKLAGVPGVARKLNFREIAALVKRVKPFVRNLDDEMATLGKGGKKIVNSTLLPRLKVYRSNPAATANGNVVFAYSDPAVRRQMFPRFALFKGSANIDGAGGAALGGFGSSYSISRSNVAGGGRGLYTHVAQDPRQAGLYGRVLNVWNAKKVPGAMNGNMRFFDNLIAESHVSPDYTRVSGLYRVPKGSGHRSITGAVTADVKNTRGGINRRVKLDTTRGNYLDSFGEYSTFGSANNMGEAESLIDISKYKPSRSYVMCGPGAIEVTPLARYRRSLTNPEDITALDAIVSSLNLP